MTSFRVAVRAVILKTASRAASVIIAVSMLLLLISCAAPKPKSVRKDIPLVPVKSTGELFNKTREANKVLESIRGVAEISVSSTNNKYKVTEIILAKRPGYLRLESLGPTGQTVLFLATNNKRIYIYSPLENRFYFGLASRKNLSMIIPLPFKSTDIVEIIQGKIDTSKYFPLEMAFKAEEESYSLILMPEDRTRGMARLTVDARTFFITGLKLYDTGKNLIIDGTFSNFRKIGEQAFPMKLKYRVPNNFVFIDIEIEYQDVKPNTLIEESRFSMTPPRGVQEIDIDKAIINFDRTPVK
jgi:outer membrane lipoprotein-sorting protein